MILRLVRVERPLRVTSSSHLPQHHLHYMPKPGSTVKRNRATNKGSLAMSVPVNITIWIMEGGDLPTGYINPDVKGGRPFPVIALEQGVSLNGYNGDPVPYLRAMAEVANRLADEMETITGGEPTP